jgi:misacylated tRNA(Ala) deacylase
MAVWNGTGGERSYAGNEGDVTELLYLSDSYLQAFEASVVAADGVMIVLDRTAFYPTGGGQPHDTGFLRQADRVWPVISVARRGSDVVHTLAEGPSQLDVGSDVAGTLDWERRYRLMRSHTALHVLCGVVFQEYGALVTGANIALERSRMDFELEDLSAERVRHIEELCNAHIAAARPVRWREIPRDEAFQIPDLVRTKINLLPAHIALVRVVEIEALDLQADGGTHVRNTSEIGGLRVVGTRSKGRSNKRLEIELVDPRTI